MGHQIVKQPNGQLAIFSDGVNAWLRWDMTPDEVVEYYAERAAESARDSARRTVEHVMNDEPRKAYYQFTETFAVLNAIAKADGQTEGPEGPVDAAKVQSIRDRDSIDNHLIFGAGQSDA